MKHLLAPLAIAGLMLVGCSAPVATIESSSPVPTVTSDAPAPEPVATLDPTPEAIATSGSYENDVLALGIKPDNMASYKEFMIQNACKDTGLALGISVRSIGGGKPENGSGPEILLLTAAYFCPEQTPEIEELLEYFEQ